MTRSLGRVIAHWESFLACSCQSKCLTACRTNSTKLLGRIACQRDFDSSSGLIEQVAQIYYLPPPLIFQDKGAFQYTFNAGSNKTLVVFATTNLSLPSPDWTSLGPPAYLGDGYYQYVDLAATNFLQRFYRAVEQ